MKHQHNAGIVAVAREIRIVQLCPRPQGHVGTLTFAKSVPETIPPDIPPNIHSLRHRNDPRHRDSITSSSMLQLA
jgi:hypothetical protein